MSHVLAEIAATGAHQVRNADSLNQTVAIARASAGAGEALATLLIDHVQEQAGKLRMYVQSLSELDKEGRAGFMACIRAHINAQKEWVKSTSPDNSVKTADPVFKMAHSSSIVRLSEFTKLAQAMDIGWVPDLTQNYHALIAMARKAIEDHSGKKETRGRPKTHQVVKMLKALHKAKEEALDDEDAIAIASLEAMCEKFCLEMGLVKEGE